MSELKGTPQVNLNRSPPNGPLLTPSAGRLPFYNEQNASQKGKLAKTKFVILIKVSRFLEIADLSRDK